MLQKVVVGFRGCRETQFFHLREFILTRFELRLFGKEPGAIDGTFIIAVNSTTRTDCNAAACQACHAREQCTKSTFRKLLISGHQEALDRARELR